MLDQSTNYTDEQTLLQKVQTMLNRYGWQLLTVTSLYQRTQHHIKAYADYTLDQAIKATYMGYLYECCVGTHGINQRERGYEELHRLLYQHAVRRQYAPCDEVCQQTLVMIFEKIEHCRNPFAFWEFANSYLLNAFHELHRKTYREQSLEALNDDGATFYGVRIQDDSNIPINIVLDHERKAIIIGYMQEFLARHPRAHKQIAALWLKFVTGLDDRMISQLLETSVDHVYTLRNRAIKRLRRDPLGQTIAQYFGIFAD